MLYFTTSGALASLIRTGFHRASYTTSLLASLCSSLPLFYGLEAVYLRQVHFLLIVPMLFLPCVLTHRNASPGFPSIPLEVCIHGNNLS